MKTLGARALAPLPRGVTLAAFGLVLVAIVALERQVTGLGPLTGRGTVIDAAATVDLTLGASLIAFWMLGRDFRWSPWTLVPLYFGSLALAAVALPDDHEGALRFAHLAAVPLELLAIAFLARKVMVGRRAFRAGAAAAGSWDARAALQRAVDEALGPGRAADAMAYELTVLWYALAAGRTPPDREEALSYHVRSAYGAIVFALLLATAVEVVGLHFLVSLWSHRVAWILTALGAYGALWIFADWRACRLRPVVIVDGVLRIHFGLRWRLDVPIEAVRAVRAPTSEERAERRSVDLRLALPGTRWQVLELDRAVEAQGIYGLRRPVRTLGLGLDEPARLEAALAEATTEDTTDDGQR